MALGETVMRFGDEGTRFRAASPSPEETGMVFKAAGTVLPEAVTVFVDAGTLLEDASPSLEEVGMVFGDAGMAPSYERTMTYLTRTKTIPNKDHRVPNTDAPVL